MNIKYNIFDEDIIKIKAKCLSKAYQKLTQLL